MTEWNEFSWNEFSTKRILEVKQRIQTVVIYEELEEPIPGGAEVAVKKEAVVDSYDRPTQAQYT